MVPVLRERLGEFLRASLVAWNRFRRQAVCFSMPAAPPDPGPHLPKVIIADADDGAAPLSTPYRTTDVFQAIVELDAMKRENARLRSTRRRSNVGVILALAASCTSLAVFSTVLFLRQVPAKEAMAAPMVTCPTVAAEVTPVAEPPVLTDPLFGRETESPAVLDELGGQEALKPLAREVTAALLADPVLQKNPRIAAVGRTRLETAVRQQLIVLADGTAEPDVLDVTELMWEIRATHAEWEAATEVLDNALAKHHVSDDNRSAIGVTVASNESTVVDDIALRATALARRASVGLSCPEEAITSRPLETSDTRVVSGCGKRGIYAYGPDASTGVSAWRREPNP